MTKPATPPPVPATVHEMLTAIYYFANGNNLGVISALSKQTQTPRFVLAGRVPQPDGSFMMMPLGYLSPTIANEVVNPAEVGPTVTVEPDPDADTPPLDDYTATMIAEGVIEADEDATLRAWQHLEDTGLGYKLQGWFGRRLQDLIAAGSIRPRKSEDD